MYDPPIDIANEEAAMDELHEYNSDGPIHLWFGLSYSSYMVLQRTILQSMPHECQQKLIDLLDEVEETLEIPEHPNFQVLARNDRGRFIEDPLRDYNRGRTRMPFKQKP